MRHILLALLTSVGLAASVQTAIPQPSKNLAGLINVAGTMVEDVPIGAASRFVCRNLTSVTGVVISPKIIQMSGIVCGNPMGEYSKRFGDYLAKDAITRDGFRVPSDQRPDKSVVTMNVRLARPEDAQRMLPGKIVTLSGDFSVVTTNRANYLIADNAKYLHDNPFGG